METNDLKRRPAFSEQRVKSILLVFYGIKVSRISEIDAYLGRNYHIIDKKGIEYVFKASHLSEDIENLEFENGVMDYLNDSNEEDFCPKVYQSVFTKKNIIAIKDELNRESFGRLISFSHGKIFARTNPHSQELLFDLGSFMAKIDNKLLTYPGLISHRTLEWDMKNALQIKNDINRTMKGAERKIVNHFVTLYENQVIPNSAKLRQSLIHNDGNDYNLFTGVSDDGRQYISGIIDFGDMVKTYVIAELAITAAYAMLYEKEPLITASLLIKGYHAFLPLTELEIKILFSMICMRLCVIVVNSALAKVKEPDNKYLQISEKPAWVLLKKLYAINHRYAYYLFREACNLGPDKKIKRICKWIKNQASTFAPILPKNFFLNENILVFDLGVESKEIKNPSQINNMEEFSEYIFSSLKSKNKKMGIGRYNEARLCYTSDQFKNNDTQENRTIHIGLDMFVPPSTPIFTPLEGIVHSFRRIAAPLDYGQVLILEHQTGSDKFYTLYGHLSKNSIKGLIEGKKFKKGEKIASIGDFQENGHWPPHLHFQIILDMFGKKGDFEGVAAPTLRELYKNICPDPNLIVNIPNRLFPKGALAKKKIKELRDKHMSKTLSLHYQVPLNIVRGYMQYLYDDQANAYLDTVNNVCHIGHSNPFVVDRLCKQAYLLNTNSRYYHENIVQLAQRLTNKLPKSLEVCFFVNSGSEANELALRLAKAYTKSNEFIVMENGYHGNTNLLIDISHYKFSGKGGAGKKSFVHTVEMPYPFRYKPYKQSESCGKHYSDQVKTVINKLLLKKKKPAAFICESIIGVGGQVVLPLDYLKRCYQYVRNAGGVCIADEVQVGMGRVGNYFWGFEISHVVPDIITIGKPVGNGHPLAVVITSKEIAQSFNQGMEYFNTFGGNPVSCAAGLAVLDYIRDHKLQQHTLKIGNYFIRQLKQLQKEYPIIGDVRGAGLFLGVELVLNPITLTPATNQANYIFERMKTKGIFTSTEGPYKNVLKIKPPIIISRENVDFFVNTLEVILREDFCQI